jgi:putative radical SAM enzyme (TIGR03279 family)
VVASVAPHSPAEGLLIIGDEIIEINDVPPTDVIEFQQLTDGDEVRFLIQRPGESLARLVHVHKEVGRPLGVVVDSAVFDRIRTCDNHCTFCFIYQLPKGLRRSLYVKDDDYRLSFLYGNFTTLTRFTELDLERVIDERLSPLYVSIHTTNPELRATMLRNPRGATSLQWLRALLDAGIEVHGQVVVCPGVNDGPELLQTLEDSVTEYADLATLSVVPIGVSRFSTEADMRPHSVDEARAVVDAVEHFGQMTREVWGRTFAYASDEFYLQAAMSPPTAEQLDSLDQAENGVGLVAAFTEDFRGRRTMDALGTGFFQSVDAAPAWGYRAPRGGAESSTVGPPVIVTGEYAGPLLRELLAPTAHRDTEILVVPNEYFGGNIKVAGLLTGTDLRAAIARHGGPATYLLPDVCLNEGRFLDGVALDELGPSVSVVPTTGSDLRRTLDHHAALVA